MSVARLCLWLLRYPLRRWSWLLGMLAVMLLKVGLDLLKPWPMKILVDHVLHNRPMPSWLVSTFGWLPGGLVGESLLFWAVASTVLLFLLGWALSVATAFADVGFGRRLTYDLAADVLGHLQRLSLRFHQHSPTGDMVRRVTSDCDCVSKIVKDALLPALVAIVGLVAMFLVMWSLDPALTLLSVGVVPVLVVAFARYSGPMAERGYREEEAGGRIYTVVERSLSAIPVVQAFGGEERANREFRAATDEALAATLAATGVQLRFKVLTGLATALGTASIMWLGAEHVLDGSLTLGSILVFLSYLASLYAPLQAIMYSSSTVQSAAGSGARVREVLDAEREVDEPARAADLPRARGHIRIEGVTFGYSEETPVLHDVSLEISPGQTVAIVGPTGSGKTTLASLVPRFIDSTQGRVLLDGYDVRAVRLKSLREQVAVVLQETFLFPISIADNIAYGRPRASRREIEQVARAANAHKFIEKLPDGYDTIVGERGATLSGGERQRIAIARAFLKNAPILILDEPTSALDVETERLLLEALQRLMQGRTTIIIAHRLSTIRNADKIVVIKEGRIVEQGTHNELITLGGFYAYLYGIQFGETQEPSY